MGNKLKVDLGSVKLPVFPYTKSILTDVYYRGVSDRINFSYWFTKISGSGIPTPKSITSQFTLSEFFLVQSLYDNPNSKELEAMVVKIIVNKLESMLKSFKGVNKFFMKNGTYSHKFDFSKCTFNVNDSLEEVALKFLDLNYESHLKSAGGYTEIVIREFVETDVTKTIYNGMPMNMEYRAFYDFDNFEFVGIVPYWDINYMLEEGFYTEDGDTDVLRSLKDVFKFKFTSSNKGVMQFLNPYVSDERVGLSGIWSVDVMEINDGYVLIDMAPAEVSAFYDKVKK